MRTPPEFSAPQWEKLTADQRLHFWEGWAAGLRYAMKHVTPEGLGELSRELAAAEEEMNQFRA